MSIWLKLSDELYCFGPNAIDNIREYKAWKVDGSESDYKTALYSKTSQINVVKESIQEIEEKLMYGK